MLEDMKRSIVYAVTDKHAYQTDDVIDSDIRYGRLVSENDGYSADQFVSPPPKIPWKAILLASTLFLLGTLLIAIGSMLLAGMIDTKYSDRTWPILILGSILFLPGFYHVRLAYYAYQGYRGYSFDDIPDFD